ncbi:MAG: radical SAM protein [Peptococcaceae bacterium]|nr:radical SAM protein [Peptococcaceae bacterium]
MEYTFAEFNQALYTAARERRAPLVGHFELTRRCNLGCIMCYIRQKAGDAQAMREELSAAQWIDLARQARDEGMLYLLLTGGEVLVRKDFFQILEGVSSLGLMLSLSTNATLLTPALARELARYPLGLVMVTLYGASAATYGQVTGVAAGFERTLRGVRLLQEQGVPLKLRSTMIRQNVADLQGLLAIAEDLGLELGLDGGLFGHRRSGVDSEPFAVRLTPEERLACEELYRRAWAQKQGVELPEPSEPRKITPPDPEEISSAVVPGGKENAFRCASGHFSFTVNPDGRLCACMLMAEPSVSLLPEFRFREAWAQLGGLSDQVPVCPECQVCAHRKICQPCPARLQGETGSAARKAPYLCRKAELLAGGQYPAARSFYE